MENGNELVIREQFKYGNQSIVLRSRSQRDQHIRNESESVVRERFKYSSKRKL